LLENLRPDKKSEAFFVRLFLFQIFFLLSFCWKTLSFCIFSLSFCIFSLSFCIFSLSFLSEKIQKDKEKIQKDKEKIQKDKEKIQKTFFVRFLFQIFFLSGMPYKNFVFV